MLLHRTIDSPIGALTLYSSPTGLRYLAFTDLESADTLPRGSVEDQESAADTVRQVRAYFAGELREFFCAVDVPGETFQVRAQHALGTIPYGHTRTYTQLADAAGNAAAVRAAGTACARNPVPLIWPCHRVIRSDGSWGAYRGGPDAKNWLLRFEAQQLMEGN